MPKKLLLADDSATIQRVIEMTFAGEDVQVLTAGDGEEAIARIAAERPDIVLADIGMPKRSGYEVSAFVKGNPELSKTPVLLLAGAFEPVDDAKAKEVKCDGVLVKPFEPQQVIARVRELLDGGSRSSTQSAVHDIPRPAAALTPPRPVELPKRQEKPPIPDDLVDIEADDLMPAIEDVQLDALRLDDARLDDARLDEVQIEPEITAAAQPLIMDDSLDDYFDKLDEAFSTINTSGGSQGASPSRIGEPPPPPRPDRPVLERDLESFDGPLTGAQPSRAWSSDEPLTIETSVHIETPGGGDPFADLDSLHVDEAAVPTLDDLLAGMPPTPAAPEISFDDELVEPEASKASTFIPSEPPRGPERSAPPAPVEAAMPPAPQPAPARVESAVSSRSIIADAFSALLAAEQGEGVSAAPLRLPGNGSAPVVTDAMVDDVARRVIAKLALGSSDQMQAVVRDIVSGVAERLVREEIDRIRRNAGSS